MTIEDAKEYLYSFSTARRAHKFQDIKVNLYIWPKYESPTASPQLGIFSSMEICVLFFAIIFVLAW